MKIKRIIFGLVIVVILSFLGYLGYQQYLAPVESTPTVTAIETAVITINAEGRVVPFRHLSQAFEIPGKVEAIQVEEGDQVNNEDVLLSLDKEILQTLVAQAEAALKAAQAQCEMLPKKASDEQKDQAKAQIEQARAVLKAAQLQVKKAELNAALSGVVILVKVEEGQVIDAGMPVIIIADTSLWKVETLDLLEEDMVNVKIGMPAEVKFAAYPDLVVQGRVSQIAGNASTYQGNVTYQVTIDLISTEDLDLTWGMTSFVEIDHSKSVIPPQYTPTPSTVPTKTDSPTLVPSITPKPEKTRDTNDTSDTNDANEESRPSSYTVQEGEFVYCLGRRFDIKPIEILSYNGLPPGAALFPGQIIQLPQNSLSFPLQRALSPHPADYIVKPFDTFYIIACQFGDVFPEDIAEANDLDFSTVLVPDQVLYIP